jgi:hypothetical protein
MPFLQDVLGIARDIVQEYTRSKRTSKMALGALANSLTIGPNDCRFMALPS